MTRDLVERWRSFQYRRLFPGLTEEGYLDTPVGVIEWDFQLARIDSEIQQAQIEKNRGKGK